MANNETLPEREEAMVAMGEAAVAKHHQYIHGGNLSDVETESGPVPTIAKQAKLYLDALPNALAELSTRSADGRVYASEAIGRLTVTDGQLFYAKSADPLVSRTLWQRVSANASTKIADDASAAAIKQIRDRIGTDKGSVLVVRDDAGYAGLQVKPDSIVTKHLVLSVDGVRMGNQAMSRTKMCAYALADPKGFVTYMVTNDGKELGRVVAPVLGFTTDAIARANVKGLASSEAVLREYNTEVARPIWDLNHFMEYGQSLSTAYEGWPVLSKAVRLGNLMLGGSVRPASRAGGGFTPVGEAVLMPLKAVVQNLDNASIILTDDEVAALPPGAGNEGEASIIGMVNLAKKLHNQRMQVANDELRLFVASCCGVSGQPIERLLKGDSTNRWLRLTQAASKVKAAALAQGKSYGLVGVSFLQGEYNYSDSWGGVETKDEYKQKLAQLYADIESDIVAAIADQSDKPPLFMTYQTGAAYTRDTHDLAIGMAQWELSKERANWVLATPVYPYPDKGGHLTANGYRWVGKQFAKVWHRVVELGQNWKPLSPLEAQVKGREALITFHVPHPPLAFDMPIVGRTPTDYLSKGFTALDDSGALVVATVEIAADCVVRLSFARDPVGQVFIRYADKNIHGGNGCLRDSDPTMSDDAYEYMPGTGMYADENIPHLVGKPYPLHNWCIAFHIPTVGAQ